MVHYSACQDAIWGLDSLGQIFIRTLSSSCPTGMHWTKLDLSQLGMTFLLSRLSVNSQQTVCIFIQKCIWFIDLKYNIYWSKQYLTIMVIAAEDCKTRGPTYCFQAMFHLSYCWRQHVRCLQDALYAFVLLIVCQ